MCIKQLHEAIGGYFELELPQESAHYHDTPYRLNTGRAALKLLLDEKKPKKLYIPYYNCDVVRQVIRAENIPFQYYRIDKNLEIVQRPDVGSGEMLLCVDYYGIKSDYIKRLSDIYGETLIIDASQSFYLRGDGRSYLFNSARKYFGVPDGAYLYVPKGVSMHSYDNLQDNAEYSIDHLCLRLMGNLKDGYKAFQANESRLDGNISKMSLVSSRILSGINYEAVAEVRNRNYDYLHDRYSRTNVLCAKRPFGSTPLCYPLNISKAGMHEILYKKQIFAPIFWKEICSGGDGIYSFECVLAETTLPLPIDQRYSLNDMKRLFEILKATSDNE